MGPYAADALASASCRCGGSRYLSWLVYDVRSMLICLSSSTIRRAVDSLPLLNWLPRSRSRCLVQHTTVHMMRLGTFMATGCVSPAKRDA